MFEIFKRKTKPPGEEIEAEFATLYISDPSLLGSKVLNEVKGILSYEGLSDGDRATGLRLKLKAGSVQMNFMLAEKVEEHLQGMSKYFEPQLPDKENAAYVLTRINSMRFIIGCVVTPGFDKAGTILETLKELNHRFNGLFLFADSLFDHDGEPLAGPAREAN